MEMSIFLELTSISKETALSVETSLLETLISAEIPFIDLKEIVDLN